MTYGTAWFEELTANQAREALDRYLASLPDRLERLRNDIAASGGGPTLTGGDEQLLALAEWLAAQPIDLGAPRHGDIPVWGEVSPALMQDWGPRLLAWVDGTAAFVAECFRSRWPDATCTWTVNNHRGDANFRHPMFVVDSYMFCLPEMVRVGFMRIVTKKTHGPEELVRWYELINEYIGASRDRRTTREEEQTHEDAQPTPTVDALADESPWTVQITFDDVTAHERESDIAALLDAIQTHRMVDRAIWEDREVLLVALHDPARQEQFADWVRQQWAGSQ